GSTISAAGRPLVIVSITSTRSQAYASTHSSSHGTLNGQRYGYGASACFTAATALGSGRHAACAVMLLVSSVRPEYARRNAMTSLRPVYMHASITAVSTASEPLLVKSVRLSPGGASSASRRAAPTCSAVTYSVEVCPRRPTCSRTRSTTAG